MEYLRYIGIKKRRLWEKGKIGGEVYLCARGKKNVKNLTLDEACRAYSEVIEILLAFNPSECSRRFLKSQDRLQIDLWAIIILLDPNGYGVKDGHSFPKTPELEVILKTGQLPGFNDSFTESKKIRKALESLFNK